MTARRIAITAMLAFAVLPVVPAAAQSPKPEPTKVRFVVGGKAGIFYLPLTATERLGYFKEAGLDVEISDVASGARSLQSIVGGSADIGTGTFDHTIQMQAQGQSIVGFVQYGNVPGFVLAMMSGKADRYRTPADLKGMKIGVTSPGSSSHFMAAYLMVRNGLKADDASFIGTGTTSTAVAAARRAEIDAIVSSDPMIGMMEAEGLVKIVLDTRTMEGNKAVYGGPLAGGIVYATQSFIEKNPATVEAVATAFVRTAKWIAVHSHEEIAKLMPEDYALGNPALYVKAVAAAKPGYSADGRFIDGAVETAYQVLKLFDPQVATAKVDLGKTHTNAFVDKALPRVK
jgi:NitT/TauT family transport system substrate-binding protein